MALTLNRASTIRRGMSRNAPKPAAFEAVLRTDICCGIISITS